MCCPRLETLSEERVKEDHKVPAFLTSSEFAGCSQILQLEQVEISPSGSNLFQVPISMHGEKFKSSPPAEEFQVKTGQLG